MTLAEMKTDVRRRLNESGTEFFSDDDIAVSLQEGLDEIADITEYYEREATIGLLTGRTYYDLRTVLPDTFLSPRAAWNTTTSRWLTATDTRDQDEHTFVQWELTYGEPVRYLMRGNWWLGVWPRNSNDSGGLRFPYTSIPAPLEDDEEPTFPIEFHPAIPDFALFDLLGQERETQKALLLWASFLETSAGLKKHVQARQRIPRRDVL
jgi:hypothetical protein